MFSFPGLLTIGERVNVVEYADREWKGTTDMATRIKQVSLVHSLMC